MSKFARRDILPDRARNVYRYFLGKKEDEKERKTLLHRRE
jgi:hypothetical protein